MKPPLPRILSAVPQALHTRIEIAKAIRALTGPSEDELLRQRRVEIAAIRRDLETLSCDVRKAGEECLVLFKAELRAELKKYNPTQPRCRPVTVMAGSGRAKVRRGAKHRARQCATPPWKLRLAVRDRTWQLVVGLPLIRMQQIPKMS